MNLPLLVAIVGGLIYLVSSFAAPAPSQAVYWSTKVGELGRVAFWCGLLAWLLHGRGL